MTRRERVPEINCEELSRLARDLHPDTKIEDLETEERSKVFPDLVRQIDEVGQSGRGALSLVLVHLKFDLNHPSLLNMRLADLRKKKCENQ